MIDISTYSQFSYPVQDSCFVCKKFWSNLLNFQNFITTHKHETITKTPSTTIDVNLNFARHIHAQ